MAIAQPAYVNVKNVFEAENGEQPDFTRQLYDTPGVKPVSVFVLVVAVPKTFHFCEDPILYSIVYVVAPLTAVQFNFAPMAVMLVVVKFFGVSVALPS